MKGGVPSGTCFFFNIQLINVFIYLQILPCDKERWKVTEDSTVDPEGKINDPDGSTYKQFTDLQDILGLSSNGTIALMLALM